jgi:hypothetical protein
MAEIGWLCGEAVGLLKDKMCPMAVFDVLRKMSPLRHFEATDLLINATTFLLVMLRPSWPERHKHSWQRRRRLSG